MPAAVGRKSVVNLSGLFLLSVGTLSFEITLTRLFSVAQFYHFAFMIISLAMLGFGASGMVLSLFPRKRVLRNPTLPLTLALLYGLTSVGAYLVVNLLPFDSFSIAWDRRQVIVLALQYCLLALPFFCSGMVLGYLFMLHPRDVGNLYATNFFGSAVGCLMALMLPRWLGGEGVVVFSGLLSVLAALCFAIAVDTSATERIWRYAQGVRWCAILLAVSGLFILIHPPAILSLRLSPYKGLSYALQFPGAQIVSQQWNGFSRVDLVESTGVRSLPGLSYRSSHAPPPQWGVFVDGDHANPVLRLSPMALRAPLSTALAFTGFMPSAVAYQLRPGAQSLILEAKGGLALWIALAQEAGHVTVAEANPLIVVATEEAGAGIYRAPWVTSVLEDSRSYVRRTSSRFDIVTLPLTAPYRPVRSGAYSLAEDYHMTVEAFRDYFDVIAPDGLLVMTRWLQLPPSESLRTFALLVTALEQVGGNPATQIVAFRGYATMTFLVKNDAFTTGELAKIREFAQSRAFDLVLLPGMQSADANLYNILPEPVYYQTFASLLAATNRRLWYRDYAFDVTPPTDDHPFFGHFFKWTQARQVLAEFGKTWQPFGGAGYFVLLILLALALAASGGIILLPLVIYRFVHRSERVADVGEPLAVKGGGRLMILAYFALLGLGYLMVEIPLMQRFILFLGHPAYALTTVLCALLLFSGVGSLLSRRLSLRWVLIALVILSLVVPLSLPGIFAAALGWPLWVRIFLSFLILAPLGVLMGVPFPAGLHWLEDHAPQHVSWAWGVNGAASVVASVLAALLALSMGFRWVLMVGALCYGSAWIVAGRGMEAGSDSVMPSPVKGTKATPPRL